MWLDTFLPGMVLLYFKSLSGLKICLHHHHFYNSGQEGQTFLQYYLQGFISCDTDVYSNVKVLLKIELKLNISYVDDAYNVKLCTLHVCGINMWHGFKTKVFNYK